ncbi:Serine carboxypeptidase [Giardia muris]|uniref:Serine carboxypeptidase n=1 Tax=Giardia muris TaxID=5742 RepID=A0A4Z1STQ3_GIAMU|nr:Serine carboxypeptidase [Giardia muris]|eukprot:TNJ27018.1 Serine carboxypeptidase [Giardia muris]
MFLIVLLISLVFALPPRRSFMSREIESAVSTTSVEFWFDEQYVDHFSATNRETWSHRYFYNDTHYQPGGPIILFIGGEAPLSTGTVGEKYSVDFFARHLGGVKVALEHRYYGSSFPHGQSDGLEALSSRQALADLARFLPFVKRRHTLPDDTPVIVVGGSYPGNLAAWARTQFPFAIAAAISSSGPYLAQLNFPEYLAHTEQQIRKYGGEECVSLIGTAFSQAEELLTKDIRVLAEIFDVSPEKIANATVYDKANFLSALLEPCTVVQYALPDNFTAPNTDGDIKAMCKTISHNVDSLSIQENSRELRAYAAWLLSRTGSLAGLTFRFNDTIVELQNTSMESPMAVERSWYWQTCTEFGYYQGTENTTMFGTSISLDYFLEICYRAFFLPRLHNITRQEADAIVTESVSITNLEHGGRYLKLNGIYVTDGTVDPWSRLSYTDTLGWKNGAYLHPESEFSLIEDGSHCSDLYMSWERNEDVRNAQLIFLQRRLGLVGLEQ